MNWLTEKKRAWFLTAGYVTLIYTTLGIVGSFSLWLRRDGWQTAVSTAIMITAFALVLYLIIFVLKRRSFMSIVAMMAAGLMYSYIMISFAPAPSDKIHLLEYSLLAALLFYALKIDIAPKSAYLLAWVITTFTGLVDEMIQYYLPTRAFDLNDLMINAMAAGVALFVVGFVVEHVE